MSYWKVTRIQTAVLDSNDFDIPEWIDDIENYMEEMSWNLSFLDFDTTDQYVERVEG